MRTFLSRQFPSLVRLTLPEWIMGLLSLVIAAACVTAAVNPVSNGDLFLSEPSQ